MYLLILLFILSGWNINTPVICARAEFRYIHPVNHSKQPEYNTGLYLNLDKGLTTWDQKRAILEDYIATIPLCDFQVQEHYTNRDISWGYVPAQCVPRSKCRVFYESVGEWSDKTCQLFKDDEEYRSRHWRIPDEEFVCCPVQAYENFKQESRIPKHKEWDSSFNSYEVPSFFRLYDKSPYTAISQRYASTVRDQAVLARAFNVDYKAKIRNEYACGFRKGDVITPASQSPTKMDVRAIILFFCVVPSKCRNTLEERRPHPTWNFFCSNVITRNWLLDGKTQCCHSEDIDKSVFGETPLALPQVPLYVRFAAGVKSAYKCEEYSKLTCNGTQSACVPGRVKTPPFAALGFVRPKVMMFHCGGTLISARYILSSSFCAEYFGFQTNVALLGEYQTQVIEDNDERTYAVTLILPYVVDAFRKTERYHKVPTGSDKVDLALYMTWRDVWLLPNIRPACLFHAPITFNTSVLEFGGYGPRKDDAYRSSFQKTKDLELQETSRFPYQWNDDPWYSKHNVNHPFMMVFLGADNFQPCKSDLGGPLYHRIDTPHCSILLKGVLSSRIERCTVPHVSVFINVTQFIFEIEQEIWGKYTFLDVLDADLLKKQCVDHEDLMFFNLDPAR